MVGVGSGSALNAFNIGQAATGQTAVGKAISDIVAQADKLQLAGAGSAGGAASGIAAAQYKNQIEENQRGNIYGVGDDTQPIPLALDVKVNRDKVINLKSADFTGEPIPSDERLPIMGSPEAEKKFFEKNPRHRANPNRDIRGDFLTPEEEQRAREDELRRRGLIK